MSDKALARTAGILYLFVAVFGGFSEYVRSSATVAGNAAATAVNVSQHSVLFRIAFAADLADFACFLGVGLIMFALLKSVNTGVAVAMLVINAVSVAIQALNMLNHGAALLAATDPGFASPAQVAMFLELHRLGYLIAQIYFGLYLLPLGYLVYKSGLFPRVLGIVLIAGSAGYALGVVAAFASPGFTSSLAAPLSLVGGLGETVFLLWLLIVGIRSSRQPIHQQGAVRWSA